MGKDLVNLRYFTVLLSFFYLILKNYGKNNGKLCKIMGVSHCACEFLKNISMASNRKRWFGMSDLTSGY